MRYLTSDLGFSALIAKALGQFASRPPVVQQRGWESTVLDPSLFGSVEERYNTEIGVDDAMTIKGLFVALDAFSMIV